MSFAWFIARRYLTARRRQAFISLISAVSIVGVGVGVMALIIALALMTGVQGELRDRIVGSTAHIYVYKPGGYGDVAAEVQKMRVPGVIGVAPAVVGLGLLQSTVSEGEVAQIKAGEPATIVDLLVATGLCESRGAARRSFSRCPQGSMRRPGR